MKYTDRILAGIFGFLLGIMVALALVNHTLDAWRTESEQWHQLADKAIKGEADCESKFAVGTVLFEPRAPRDGGTGPGFDVPLAAGLGLRISPYLGSAPTVAIEPGAPAPVWMIPAQVKPITNQSGARYRWVDLKSGNILGEYDVTPTPAAEQVQ